jgi:hypothetical protein
MSVLDESVRQVLQLDGARAVALIDAGTGMIVSSAGEFNAGVAAAAESMAQEVRAVTETWRPDSAGGALEEISVLTERRCHLLDVLELRRGEGLLLFVDVDLASTNLALAALSVRRLIPGLLA